MDGYNSNMSYWHGLLRKTPLKVNEISYNHHFTMNDDWHHVPNMVSDGDSMLIDVDWPKNKKCNISASN